MPPDFTIQSSITPFQSATLAPYQDVLCYPYGLRYLCGMIHSKPYASQVEGRLAPQLKQNHGEERISLFHFISDLPHAIFHVDRGILFNFVQLIKRPAASIQDYLDGHLRKRYFHPATYLVIALLFNYLVVKITDLHFYDEQELMSMTPLAAQAIRDYDKMQWWFLEHTYIYILLAIPVSSLFLYTIFRLSRLKFNVAETAVIVLFTIAQGVFFQSLIYLSLGWINDGPFLRCMEAGNMTMLIFYASFVSYQFLCTIRNKAAHVIISIVAGAGLAVVWILSAYIPYLLLH